jgi:hypothetical protein
MHRKTLFLLLAVVVISLILISCSGSGGSASSLRTTGTTTGTVYVTGSDAPLPSVVSFQIDITSLTLSDGTNTVSLITDPQTIEFSRLLGLRTLLALNSVPAGNYTSATVVFANPKISYLDTSTTPVSVGTMNGSLTATTRTITFGQPLTVAAGGLGALHFHLNIKDSLAVDGSGQMTGVVTPAIQVRPLAMDDDDAEIDEFRGSLVSITAPNFVLQNARGRQFTVVTSGTTVFDPGESINTMSMPAMVEVAGKVRADGALVADRVHVIVRDRAFLAGLVLDPIPATGDASSMNLLVREEIPDVAGVTPGKPFVVNIASGTVFDIYRFEMPAEQLIFNQSKLVRGQRVTVGGFLDNAGALQTRRIVLEREGHEGVYKAGSLNVVSGNTGTFQINLGGTFGYLMGNQITVATGPQTRFRGVTGLSGVANSGTKPVCVVGLLLKDQSGNPVLYAGLVAVDRENMPPR